MTSAESRPPSSDPTNPKSGSVGAPPRWQIVLAFAIIYLVWGSTFLAIRVGVHEVPPLLLAAMRFSAAGIAMYLWLRWKGTAKPSRREWLAASFLGLLIFVLDYGCLFWAKQRVPSGIAAVILATIPVFMTLSEIIFLRTQRLTLRLVLALLVGLFGVAILMNNSLSLGEAPVDRGGALALLIAAVSWSVAAAFNSKLPLPKSKPMSAAAQMLAGGVQLTILAALTGEFRGFHIQAVSFAAWFSLVYLTVAGSGQHAHRVARRRRPQSRACPRARGSECRGGIAWDAADPGHVADSGERDRDCHDAEAEGNRRSPTRVSAVVDCGRGLEARI